MSKKTMRVLAKTLKPGDLIRLEVEGRWRPWDDINKVSGHGRVVNDQGQTVAATTDLSTVDKVVDTPDWQPGDVVLVKFYTGGIEYTYVRGKTEWPGTTRPLADEDMDRLFLEGKLRHIPAAKLQAMATTSSQPYQWGKTGPGVKYNIDLINGVPNRFTGKVEEYR